MLFFRNQLVGIITGTVKEPHRSNGELIILDMIVPNNYRLIALEYRNKVFRDMVIVYGSIQQNIGYHIVCPD